MYLTLGINPSTTILPKILAISLGISTPVPMNRRRDMSRRIRHLRDKQPIDGHAPYPKGDNTQGKNALQSPSFTGHAIHEQTDHSHSTEPTEGGEEPLLVIDEEMPDALPLTKAQGSRRPACDGDEKGENREHFRIYFHPINPSRSFW